MSLMLLMQQRDDLPALFTIQSRFCGAFTTVTFFLDQLHEAIVLSFALVFLPRPKNGTFV